MENLVKKLQEEVGLTEDQAIKTLSVVKDFMDKEGLQIDWEKFFKGKYEDFSDKIKAVYQNVTKQGHSYTDVIADKVEDLAAKARHSAHELTKKAADFLDDDKK